MQVPLRKRWQVADPITSEVSQALGDYPDVLKQLLI